MKLRTIYTGLLIVSFLGALSPAFAQKSRKSKPDPKAWTVGAKGGVNIYFGDLKYWDYIPNTKYGELTYGGGISIGKYLSPKFSITTDLGYFNLSGTKRNNSTYRTFDTKYQFANINLNINFLQVMQKRPKLNRLSAWGSIGIGYARWKSILYDTKNLDTLNTVYWGEKKYLSTLAIPAGLHLKYFINKNFSLDAHSSLVFVNSDLLDAKADGNKIDYFWHTGVGVNYHFSLKPSNRRVPLEPVKNDKDIHILDFYDVDPFGDPEIKRITKKEMLNQLEEKEQKAISSGNHYQVELWVPQLANNKKFRILVRISKRGITGNGFFRLNLPSGFYPVDPGISEVTYTRIAYQYDFDFYLPMNKDTLNIPIDITISERGDGTYPIFIEGEVMNQEGKLFPVKNAQYVQIQDGIEYNDVPMDVTADTLSQLEDENMPEIETKTTIENREPSQIRELTEEEDGVISWRIQIVACRQPCKTIDAFLTEHGVDVEVSVHQSGQWYRYTVYSLESREEAEKSLAQVRSRYQIPEAFIVQFKNSKRLEPGTGNKYVYSESDDEDIDDQEFTPNDSDAANFNAADQEDEKVVSVPQKKKSEKPHRSNSAMENPDEETEESTDLKPGNAFVPAPVDEKISVYRVEIASAPDYPIPVEQLQDWVENENITEWTQGFNYRYTIGRFENEKVARAFLQYVRLQFALPDAHLVETKAKTWIKMIP